MQILYKLQIVNIIFTLSLYTESMKTLFLMPIQSDLINLMVPLTKRKTRLVQIRFNNGT